MKNTKVNRILMGICLSVLSSASIGYAQEFTRERYQPIVDLEPFGAELEAEEVVLPEGQVDPQVIQELSQQVRLSLIYKSETDGEVRAGFQNLRATQGQPKSFLLEVGDFFQDLNLKLVDVDLERSIASVEYHGQTVELELTKVAAPTRTARGRQQQNNGRQQQTNAQQAQRMEEIRQRLQQQQSQRQRRR